MALGTDALHQPEHGHGSGGVLAVLGNTPERRDGPGRLGPEAGQVFQAGDRDAVVLGLNIPLVEDLHHGATPVLDLVRVMLGAFQARQHHGGILVDQSGGDLPGMDHPGGARRLQRLVSLPANRGHLIGKPRPDNRQVLLAQRRFQIGKSILAGLHHFGFGVTQTVEKEPDHACIPTDQGKGANGLHPNGRHLLPGSRLEERLLHGP